MLPALAPVADLEARLGLDPATLTGPDQVRAQAALDDASALVRDEARRDFVDTDGNVDAPDAVIRVVLGSALRNYRNPDSEITQQVGPFQRSYKATEIGPYLTEAEQAIVRRYRPSGGNALWAQRTTRGEHGNDTFFVEDSFGLELFPIGSISEPWR